MSLKFLDGIKKSRVVARFRPNNTSSYCYNKSTCLSQNAQCDYKVNYTFSAVLHCRYIILSASHTTSL